MQYILVRFKQAGVHCWATAPKVHTLLSAYHRHVFHFEVRIKVTDYDREIEIIEAASQLKSDLFDACSMAEGVADSLQFGGRSCESLANLIVRFCEARAWDVVQVEVTEDGDNGAGWLKDTLNAPSSD